MLRPTGRASTCTPFPPISIEPRLTLPSGANNPDGSCKTRADWELAFNTLKSLPGSFIDVRLFASSDCGTLANAVPAALTTGTKILVGIWTQDLVHFNAEKNALVAAINAYGSSWILAISVGSEDLYRRETTAAILAGQIYDVRGMVRSMGVTQEVGHVDTWTAWYETPHTAVESEKGAKHHNQGRPRK